ncbi:MAG: CHAT domain-containing protein [Steroidobacteraceae bacterium]|nr:CHAT domain-containing protein [Steroidobacteraceae bacterium]
MTDATADWLDAVRTGGPRGLPAHSPFADAHREVEALCEAATDALRTDREAAARLVDAARSLATRVGDARLRALATRSEAMLLWASNRYQAALERYEAALVDFEFCGDELEGARTRSNALQTLIYLSRYDEALRWAESAREVFVRRNEPLRLARLDGNRANLHYRQDRLEEAIALYEDVERRFAELGQPRDIAAVLRNKAVCQLGLGQFDAALETHRAARAFCEAHGMAGLAAECDYTIANLHYQRGDYLLARSLYRDARRAAARLGDEYHVALCDLDEAELLLDLNLAEEAAASARRAVRVFRRLGLGVEATKARVFSALADAARGATRGALRTLTRARRHFREEGNALWPPLLDLYRALLLEKSGEWEAARRRCQAALDGLSANFLPGKSVHGHLLLARLALRAGDTGLAARHLAGAERVLPQTQSPAMQGHAYYVNGMLCESRGDVDGALRSYGLAQREFESLRDRLRTDDLRLAFLDDKVDVYAAQFELRLGRGELAAAFAVVERAKSQSLLATIAAPRPARVRDGSEPGRERLEYLYRVLDQVELSADQQERQRAPSLRRQVREAEAALRTARLGEDGAGVETVGCSLEEARAVLPPDTSLLQFYGARGRYHGFVVGPRGACCVPLAAIEDVGRQQRYLGFQLERARAGTAEVQRVALESLLANLQDLYEALVAPLRAHLDTRRCIVLPHGSLHSLPFHALRDGDRFLGDVHTLSVAPSAAVLRRVLQAPPRAPRPAAVFGVPDAHAPQIAEECRRVAVLLGDAHAWLGEAATRRQLEHVGAAGASILHVASHGRFRRDNPWFSALKLGDGYLTLHDLHELRLDVGLAVLSGCSTGAGISSGGDETVGLARGLLQAGVRTTVLSLWDVDDASTLSWMEAFYRRLGAGDPVETAAQSARVAVRERLAHPFHWAAFIVHGRPGFVHPAVVDG